jgi:hypothetical protein
MSIGELVISEGTDNLIVIYKRVILTTCWPLCSCPPTLELVVTNFLIQKFVTLLFVLKSVDWVDSETTVGSLVAKFVLCNSCIFWAVGQLRRPSSQEQVDQGTTPFSLFLVVAHITSFFILR